MFSKSIEIFFIKESQKNFKIHMSSFLFLNNKKDLDHIHRKKVARICSLLDGTV